MPNAVIDEYFSFIDMCPTNEDSTSRMFESVQLHGNQLQKAPVWERDLPAGQIGIFNLSNFKNLISIKKSSLDIAVQPYYQECLSEDQRNEYESNLRADFNKKKMNGMKMLWVIEQKSIEYYQLISLWDIPKKLGRIRGL